MNEPIPSTDLDEGVSSADIGFLLGLIPETGPRLESFRIGDLAREFGISLRTLRFYEDRGLLSPERRGTTRLYSRRDRARLRLVLLAKVLGFSLTEAKQIIEVYDHPGGKRRQMEIALDRFHEQHEVLQEQKREIDASLKAMEVSIDFVREQLSASTT